MRYVYSILLSALLFGCSKKDDTTPVDRVDNLTIKNIKWNSFDCSMDITVYSSGYTAKGFCISTQQNFTLSTATKTLSLNGLDLSGTISDLSNNTTYYVKGYIIVNGNTIYSDTKMVTTATALVSVGQTYQGGIVFYVDGTGEHGLVCANADLSSPLPWDMSVVVSGVPYTTVDVSGTSTSLNTGMANTNAIIAKIGAGNYAANACHNYSGSGYNDWFLPSIGELDLMYSNLKVNNIGSFSTGIYWSSSQAYQLLSWVKYFDTGNKDYLGKNSLRQVRPVRKF